MYGADIVIPLYDSLLTGDSDGSTKNGHFGCSIVKANDLSVFYYLTVLASETSNFSIVLRVLD